jgi:hypothetical protein
MRRAVPVPLQDTSCDTIRPNYQTTLAFNSSVKARLQTYIDNLGGDGQMYEQLQNSRDSNNVALAAQKLDDLQKAENNIGAYLRCLNKDIIQRNDYSSRLYTLQQDIEGKRQEVQEKQQIAKDAHERSSQLENPYNNTSWYQSWFPLGRPLRKEMVPVLLSTSILMLVFSLAIFLRFAGKELRFETVTNSANSLVKNLNSRRIG